MSRILFRLAAVFGVLAFLGLFAPGHDADVLVGFPALIAVALLALAWVFQPRKQL